jgi:hypothetical protein
LLNEQAKISGRAQAAVRPISTPDFIRIINLGLRDEEDLLPRRDTPAADNRVREEGPAFHFEERVRVQQLVSRPMRDRAFRRTVLDAYDARCALTGLKLINGGGRAEAEAAHIRPVEPGSRRGRPIIRTPCSSAGIEITASRPDCIPCIRMQRALPLTPHCSMANALADARLGSPYP